MRWVNLFLEKKVVLLDMKMGREQVQSRADHLVAWWENLLVGC